MQKIASSRPGAWFLARTQHHLDRLVFRLSAGRTTMAGVMTGLAVVVVETIGAKTGLTRTIPLLSIEDEEDPRRFAIVASNFGQTHHPAWYFNLRAHPRVRCSLDGNSAEYIAHEASGDEYQRFWNYALATYMGFPHYQRRVGSRHIPIFVMTPAA
jgi:deazaflavin-dependent oxidoreductase (nitroreductase family)